MIDFSLIQLVLTALIVAISAVALIRGRRTIKEKSGKYYAIFTVAAILLSTVSIDKYYRNSLERDKVRLNGIKLLEIKNDTSKFKIEDRKLAIDSLRMQNAELLKILENIKKKEFVIGEQNEIKTEIQQKIKINKIEIGNIEKYNNSLGNEQIYKWKGVTIEGTPTSFLFNCPQKSDADSIDIKLKFVDDGFISKIAYIYISFSKIKSENEQISLFDQMYQPQKGVNGFRLQNFLKSDKKVKLDVGYILKSENNKKYPRFERIECRNY